MTVPKQNLPNTETPPKQNFSLPNTVTLPKQNFNLHNTESLPNIYLVPAFGIPCSETKSRVTKSSATHVQAGHSRAAAVQTLPFVSVSSLPYRNVQLLQPMNQHNESQYKSFEKRLKIVSISPMNPSTSASTTPFKNPNTLVHRMISNQNFAIKPQRFTSPVPKHFYFASKKNSGISIGHLKPESFNFSLENQRIESSASNVSCSSSARKANTSERARCSQRVQRDPSPNDADSESEETLRIKCEPESIIVGNSALGAGIGALGAGNGALGASNFALGAGNSALGVGSIALGAGNSALVCDVNKSDTLGRRVIDAGSALCVGSSGVGSSGSTDSSRNSSVEASERIKVGFSRLPRRDQEKLDREEYLRRKEDNNKSSVKSRAKKKNENEQMKCKVQELEKITSGYSQEINRLTHRRDALRAYCEHQQADISEKAFCIKFHTL